MQAQANAQTQTRPPPRFHRQSQNPSHRTSPRRSPSKNQKRHQRIPSQPMQLSNSKSKPLKRQPMKTAPSPAPHQPTPKRGAPSTENTPQLSTRRHICKKPGIPSPHPQRVPPTHKNFAPLPPNRTLSTWRNRKQTSHSTGGFPPSKEHYVLEPKPCLQLPRTPVSTGRLDSKINLTHIAYMHKA